MQQHQKKPRYFSRAAGNLPSIFCDLTIGTWISQHDVMTVAPWHRGTWNQLLKSPPGCLHDHPEAFFEPTSWAVPGYQHISSISLAWELIQQLDLKYTNYIKSSQIKNNIYRQVSSTWAFVCPWGRVFPLAKRLHHLWRVDHRSIQKSHSKLITLHNFLRTWRLLPLPLQTSILS